MRSPRSWVAALLLPLGLACHSYRPVTAVAPQAIVRVTFTPARDVQVQRDRAPMQLLENITRIDGRVAAVAGDTLFMKADEILNGNGHRVSVPDDGSVQVVVVMDASARIEERQFSAGKTLAGSAGLVLLLATVAVVALIDVLVRAAR